MPANIGQMFYTGAVPWHGVGLSLSKPATLEEALRAGGLNWEVAKVDLMTADHPPSPVPKRQALVRMDLPAGHQNRILGVAHRGFEPIQNGDAGLLFDSVFGQGRPVYHTGGYLGGGEVIWLLARIGDPFDVGRDDPVVPYALMANSHDGSMAFNIRLTSVRVVCQNTLALAMKERSAVDFRRSHQGSFAEHAQAAQEYFAVTLREFKRVGESFVRLSTVQCSDTRFKDLLERLLPEPKRPARAEANPGLLRVWENRVADIREARMSIARLRQQGRGVDLPSSRGTLWSALNALLEYVDHHKETKGSQLAYALLGDGMDLKVRAFHEVQQLASAA